MFAAIWIPNLALQSVLRTESFASNDCVAVLRETAQRSVIFQANSFAQHYGVMEGQTVSQAIAKCKQLLVRPQKPLAEKAAKMTLFNCIYGLTPLIEATSHDTFTVQLQGIEPKQQHSRVNAMIQQLKAHGFFPQIGVAETAIWANYGAKCAQPLLWIDDPEVMFKDISIHTAISDPQLRSILKQWGIHSLADYARLSQQDVGRRLGKPGLDVWQSLHNKTQRILRIKVPPTEFKASMELEFEIETLEPLLFILNRLIDQLCLQLKTAFLKAKVVILQLKLEDKTHYRKGFKLPDPTIDREKLEQLLHSHLEHLQTASAITTVTLEIVPTEAQDPQTQLFQQQVKDPWKFAATLHQLVGLVGSENVGTPLLKDTHDPDAFTIGPLAHALEPLPNHDASIHRRLDVQQLKLQRYRPPLKVRVILKNGNPDHLLVNGDSQGHVSGTIKCLRGPWYSSGAWWDHHQWRRMEWDVQLESGPMLRLLYTKSKWYIEGAYG